MDLKFVNISDLEGMRDPQTKSQIRRHAMKVTGLARRRPKRKRGGLTQATLHVLGMEPIDEQPTAGVSSIGVIGQERHRKATSRPKSVATLNSAISSTDRTHRHAVGKDPFTSTSSSPFDAMPLGLNMKQCVLDEREWEHMPWVYDYSLQVMLSIRLCGNKQAMAAWSEAFLHDPLIFHATHWCASIHRSLRSRTDRWTKCSTALMHKAEAMSLLRQRLELVDKTNVDWLIYAVLCLARTEPPKQDRASLESSLLFVPHVPSANWTNVYVRSGLVEAHHDALCHLVERQGGLHRLEIPGLSYGLALTDLTAASTSCQPPRFPKYFNYEYATLESSPVLRALTSVPAGSGFESLKGIVLTDQAVGVFKGSSIIDRILSQRGLHWAANAQSSSILDARNSAQYDLLCLAPWHSLQINSQSSTHPIAYEICRLTCILYSNAVLLGLPTDNGWHRSLIKKIVGLFQLSNLDQIDGVQLHGLEIWSLCVTGIAAYELPDQSFFTKRLWQLLLKHDIRTISALHNILEGYLWSEEACGIGAAHLWKCMEVENT